MHSSLQALSKTLTVDELFYLKEQFALLEPDRNGTINLESIKKVGFYTSDYIVNIDLHNSYCSVLQVLVRNATDAMKESRVPDFLSSV